MPDPSTGLLSRVDADTIGRFEDWLDQVLRAQRVRLVNRLGHDVPLTRGPVHTTTAATATLDLAEAGVRLRSLARLEPSGVPLLVGIDGVLLARMVGALLGGGPLDGIVAAHRPLTRTDFRVGARLVEDILAGIEACLPSAANGPSAVVETGESRALGLPLPATATTLVTTVQAGTNEDRLGSFVLAFPVSLARHLWPGAAPEQAANDMNRVLPINVEVVAELARLEVPLSRLQGLAIGDTLDLGRLSDVVLRVRGEPTLRGEPGTIDGVRCVRVRSGKNLGGG